MQSVSAAHPFYILPYANRTASNVCTARSSIILFITLQYADRTNTTSQRGLHVAQSSSRPTVCESHRQHYAVCAARCPHLIAHSTWLHITRGVVSRNNLPTRGALLSPSPLFLSHADQQETEQQLVICQNRQGASAALYPLNRRRGRLCTIAACVWSKM